MNGIRILKKGDSFQTTTFADLLFRKNPGFSEAMDIPDVCARFHHFFPPINHSILTVFFSVKSRFLPLVFDGTI
jgi:hypothetical protein